MTLPADPRPGLAILLWATEPAAPERCAAPFFHALAAAAMEARVEMYFASRSVLLLAPGVAAGLPAAAGGTETVYGFMQRAAQLGVKFFACPQAMAAHAVDPENLIAECTAAAGAAAFVARVLDREWATLTY